MNFRIAVLPGDGVGPEVTAQAVKALHAIGDCYNHTFEIQYGAIGGGAIDEVGDPFPPESLELCRRSDAVLLGAVGGPKWDDPQATVRPEDGLLALRKSLELFANLRPVKPHPALIDASPLKPEVLEGVDLVVVRELTGGLYFAQPKKRWLGPDGQAAVDTLAYTERRFSAFSTPPSAWRRPAGGASLPSTRPTCWKPPVCGENWLTASPKTTRTFPWSTCWWTTPPCS